MLWRENYDVYLTDTATVTKDVFPRIGQLLTDWRTTDGPTNGRKTMTIGLWPSANGPKKDNFEVSLEKFFFSHFLRNLKLSLQLSLEMILNITRMTKIIV